MKIGKIKSVKVEVFSIECVEFKEVDVFIFYFVVVEICNRLFVLDGIGVGRLDVGVVGGVILINFN